jgi:exodeoxyribonuclease V beta subunit
MAARLTELEFNCPVPQLTAGALNDTLAKLGYRVPTLKFGQLTGYLKGFIDLIIEHRGQYFIVDWKSNHLGFSAADYAPAPLARAMAEHGYHLQHLLYTVALDRYLRLRLRNYRYETHFGGVLYLFVRGVRPSWAGRDGVSAGVYSHRPSAEVVRLLNETLGAAAQHAGAA